MISLVVKDFNSYVIFNSFKDFNSLDTSVIFVAYKSM